MAFSSSFGFGAKTTATTAPTQTSGFGFGSGGFGTPSASTPSAGFAFGVQKTTASTGFSFGTPASTPAFGTPTSTTGSTGFGFGSSASAAPSTGGFSFGTNPAASSAFGTTPSTGFAFGSNTASTGSSLFGGTNTNAFGFGAKTTASGFGFGSTTTTTQSTGFGGFSGTSAFGQPQQQLQQQQPNMVQNNLVNMGTAVSLPMIYGDERDVILAKWNQLQAYWGTGKGYYSKNGCVEFTAENPFCRFKAIGYSCIPSSRNEDGLVSITFNKSVKEVEQNQTQVVDSLHKILGSKPDLCVCVEGLKPAPEDRADLIVYILERQSSGSARRIPSTDLFTHLTSPTMSQQLQSQLSVVGVIPKAGFSQEQTKLYLETPPSGVVTLFYEHIEPELYCAEEYQSERDLSADKPSELIKRIDPILWNQAKLDNPNPDKLIPVPMIGFYELLKRRQHQEQQTKLHQSRLDMITKDIAELQGKHTNTIARTDQFRRKHLELGHRVLKLMVKQEIYRKLGYGIQIEEEQLRIQLEAIMAELSAPMQFKGRLNELMSQIRMQHYTMTLRPEPQLQMDPMYLDEIKTHLRHQQTGLQHLIAIIKDDLEDLNLIRDELSQDHSLRR